MFSQHLGNSNLVLTAEDGRNIEITLSDAGVGTLLASKMSLLRLLLLFMVVRSPSSQTSRSTLSSVVEPTKHSVISLVTLPLLGAIFGVSSDFSVQTLDISTRASSNLAIEIADLALEQISAQRASLGAIQNRLESTINNLTTNSENLSASRSRILDADFAAETANLSRNQIIQQAGVSILAQANQQPQIALSLLGQ